MITVVYRVAALIARVDEQACRLVLAAQDMSLGSARQTVVVRLSMILRTFPGIGVQLRSHAIRMSCYPLGTGWLRCTVLDVDYLKLAIRCLPTISVNILRIGR